MTGDWITDDESRTILGCTKRHIRRLASTKNWRSQEVTKQGGKAKLFHRSDVIEYGLETGKITQDDIISGRVTTTGSRRTQAELLAAVREGREDELPEAHARPDDRPHWGNNASLPESVRESIESRDWDSYSGVARTQAQQKLILVQAWRDYQRQIERLRKELGHEAAAERLSFDAAAVFLASPTALSWAEEFAGGKVPSRRTLFRWAERSRKTGKRGLVHGRHRLELKGVQIDPALTEEYRFWFLTQNKPSQRESWRRTRDWAAAEGIPCPSRPTFQRWHAAGGVSKAEEIAWREGEKALKDRVLPFMRRDYSALRSNDIWVADGHTVDVLTKGAKGKLGRRSIGSVFMDVKSRRLMGWAFRETSNSDAIILALKRGIERFGVPKVLVVDNGEDYKSRAVKAVLDELGITVTHALPYNARSKIIERQFKNVKEWFSKLWESFTGGNPQEKPERLKQVAKKHRRLPNHVLLELAFTQWVNEDLDQKYELEVDDPEVRGLTRAAAWEEHLEEKRTVTAEQLRMMCMRRSRPVTVQRNGVQMWGYDYALDLPLEQAVHLVGEKVIVRFDVLHVGSIYLYSADRDTFLCEAHQRDLTDYQATHEDIKRGMREQRKARAAVRARQKEILANRSPDDVLLSAIDERLVMEAEALEAVTGQTQKPADHDAVVRPVAFERGREEEDEAEEVVLDKAVGAEDEGTGWGARVLQDMMRKNLNQRRAAEGLPPVEWDD
jgi:putative transposase